MNKADEALADVRRWLCDSLSDGDAGKVCGMLSVVSRRIAEIEEGNAKLREKLADAPKCETCEAMLDCDECLRADDSQKERKSIAFENAKLRELVQYILDENYGDDWFCMKAEEIGLEARY